MTKSGRESDRKWERKTHGKRKRHQKRKRQKLRKRDRETVVQR